MTNAQTERYYRAVLTVAKLETAQAKQDLAFSKVIENGDGIDYFAAKITDIARIVSAFEKALLTPSEALKLILDAGNCAC